MGAQTSTGKRPLGWDDLVRRLEDEYQIENDSLDAKIDLRERGELIEESRQQVGESRREFAERVGSFVDCIDGEDVGSSIVHKTLVDINPHVIVTTNYDRIIERELNGSSEPGFNVWTYPGRVEEVAARSSCEFQDTLGDLLRSGEPLIVKIHGGVPAPDADIGPIPPDVADEVFELVMSDSSYYSAYGPDSQIPPLLRAIFVTHQVVFIGFSLRDQVIRDILQSVGSLKGSRFRHIFLQAQGSVIPEAYKTSFERSYGLVVGTYADHEKLAASLHGIMLARD